MKTETVVGVVALVAGLAAVGFVLWRQQQQQAAIQGQPPPRANITVTPQPQPPPQGPNPAQVIADVSKGVQSVSELFKGLLGAFS